MTIISDNTVVIATQNAGKVKEFADAFAPLGLRVKSLLDVPELPDVEETGATFAENAMLKARTIAELLRVPVLADDSGLAVDELGGAPGVYSARYAGEPKSDARNNEKLIRELKKRLPDGKPSALDGDWPDDSLSGARFICVLAVYDPASGKSLYAEGTCEGVIVETPRGHEGFGYDPYFYIPGLRKTMGELTSSEKHEISHRGEALRKLLRSWNLK